MAIELPDDLIQLMRDNVAAREAATTGPYSAEAWRPWLEMSTELHAAITAHAEASGSNRFDIETALKKLVLHGPADS